MYISDRTVQRLKRVQEQLDRLHPEDVPRAYGVSGSPEPRGSIIVFPGSFNPPTNAHIALLKQALGSYPSHQRRDAGTVRGTVSEATPSGGTKGEHFATEHK